MDLNSKIQFIQEDNQFIQKWLMLLKNPQIFKNQFNIVKGLLKNKKGIPDQIRGLAWANLLNLDSFMQEQSKSYQEILIETSKDEISQQQFEKIIIKDISRTFPNHPMFQEKYGYEQKSLYKILRAYATYNKEVGYLQGMGFLVAVLMNYFEESNAFWMVCCMIQRCNLVNYFSFGLPALPESYFILVQLLQKYVPDLYEHFVINKFYPSAYSLQWFITLFSINLKFENVCKIWDLFMCYKIKIIFAVGIAILKLKKEELLKLDFEQLQLKIKQIQQEIDINELIKEALLLKITNKEINDLKEDFKDKQKVSQILIENHIQ